MYWTFAFVSAVVFITKTADAAPFLTVPLQREDAVVYHGWWYKRIIPLERANHQAIDYPTELGEPVIASADGVAITAVGVVDSGHGSYGRFVLIRHKEIHEPSGLPYTTLYAHLREAAPQIMRKQQWDQNYSTWTPVERGEVIGYADTSGTTWTHLHFEVFFGPYSRKRDNRVDPYNLYAGPKAYPGDGVGTGLAGYLWTTFPPSLPNLPYTDDDGDGFSEDDGDCDDEASHRSPNSLERCYNGRDDDCDGDTDEEDNHPIGESCQIKWEGCLLNGTWQCSRNSSLILCDFPDPNACVCRDECEQVGQGVCIVEDEEASMRICAVDGETGCTYVLTQRCASNVCRDGRCVRPEDIRIPPFGNCGEDVIGRCEDGLDCTFDSCNRKRVCSYPCVIDANCGGCYVCEDRHCFRGYNRGQNANMSRGCPCTNQNKCAHGNQCAHGLYCGFEYRDGIFMGCFSEFEDDGANCTCGGF